MSSVERQLSWTCQFPLSKFYRVMSIDVKSALNISQIVARAMMERGSHGSAVNISSLASVAGDRGMGCYSAAKAALDSIARSKAHELGPYKIRVNSVQPTFISTEGTKPLAGVPAMETYSTSIPLGGKMGEIEDVVDAVVFLLSDQSRFVSGVHLRIDGAQYSRI
ncbi:hypothetical protein RvY_08285 [Ramazzottius varieornatus]|uniref:Uncharacterized protein n=1 Tax=Ramazzottius varieornatus TaxID=947166 RepID=A0A1D1V5B5_RAMVA|nr:hypothetical protein RvY_08285 [Ramazzottius varieornatus]